MQDFLLGIFGPLLQHMAYQLASPVFSYESFSPLVLLYPECPVGVVRLQFLTIPFNVHLGISNGP